MSYFFESELIVVFLKRVAIFTICFISNAFILAKEPPPTVIPDHLYNEFTMNGTIPVIYAYSDDSQEKPYIYTQEQVESFIDKAKAKETYYYGLTDTYLYQALDKYISHIENKNVAVMGSVLPWYESILLSYNACPVTIDYNAIVSLHPKLTTLTVNEYVNTPYLFDAILSISSFEHDGLGRYGDPINPNGDLLAMETTKKMLKDDGLLFLALPVGKDCLVWNLHRVYGHIRLKALLSGWRIVGYFGFTPEDLDVDNMGWNTQPVFVLKPIKK